MRVIFVVAIITVMVMIGIEEYLIFCVSYIYACTMSLNLESFLSACETELKVETDMIYAG